MILRMAAFGPKAAVQQSLILQGRCTFIVFFVTYSHASSITPTAAIMFTDIVGYTDLMAKDRDKTMELLRLNKEIQNPLVESHQGRLLKELGDGTMSTFQTASDAIDCALALQKQTAEVENLTLRIGIHLGEVVIEENDAFGDGVNIASRIQSIADPGGIYISCLRFFPGNNLCRNMENQSLGNDHSGASLNFANISAISQE